MPSLALEQWGVVAAIFVGVGGFLFGVYQWQVNRKDRQPNLVAQLRYGFLTSGPRLSPPILFVEVLNKGDKTVHVATVELALSTTKEQIVFLRGIDGTTQIPFDLETWRSEKFWVPMTEIQAALRERGYTGKTNIKARVRDAIGNNFESKGTYLNLDDNYEKNKIAETSK